jgi:hypothetical protein
MPRPKTPLIASDIVGGLVDNEHDKKHIEPRCCCKQGLRWFDELNEFRQSHWFDCHAHPHPSCPHLDAARNLDTGNSHPTGHKCVYETCPLRILCYIKFTVLWRALHCSWIIWYWVMFRTFLSSVIAYISYSKCSSLTSLLHGAKSSLPFILFICSLFNGPLSVTQTI